jgi:hypothetical protein
MLHFKLGSCMRLTTSKIEASCLPNCLSVFWWNVPLFCLCHDDAHVTISTLNQDMLDFQYPNQQIHTCTLRSIIAYCNLKQEAPSPNSNLARGQPNAANPQGQNSYSSKI